jgi:hypothetical protein
VFLDMIDDNALGFDPPVGFERIENQARAFEFIFQMRGMDQDQLFMRGSEFDVQFEHFQLVAGILVQTNFADAEDVWSGEDFWNEGNHFLRELNVLRFFGIDAEPGKVWSPNLAARLGSCSVS